MTGDARRALAENAMWSVVGAGSARRDSEELATSFVRYQGASDGSAEVRTALARDPSGSAVSVGECTLTGGVARLSGAYTLRPAS
jgi:hypothetical protein